MKLKHLLLGALFSAVSLSCDYRQSSPTANTSVDVRESVSTAEAVETHLGIVVVFVSSDFTQTLDIVGFHWVPGTTATLRIDNGADGTIDFQKLTTVDANGEARFQDYTGPPPFAVTEGDIVSIQDADKVATHVVQFIKLGFVDVFADVVKGFARAGTVLHVRVFDPGLPFPEGPDVSVTAGTSGTWNADFAASFDIVPGTTGWALADNGPGHTQFHWTATLATQVAVDIKPGSSPNCINKNSKGVTPLAILSSLDFDPSLVDPVTVALEGVSPLRWSLKKDVNDDGAQDLVLHFSTQELNAAGKLFDGNALLVEGLLKEESGGTAIVGYDFIFMAGGPNCLD